MPYWIIIILFVVNSLLRGHFQKEKQKIPTNLLSINMVLCLIIFILQLVYEAEKNQILFYLNLVIGFIILINLIYLKYKLPPAQAPVTVSHPIPKESMAIGHHIPAPVALAIPAKKIFRLPSYKPLPESQRLNHQLYKLRQYVQGIKQEEKTIWASKNLSNNLDDYKDKLLDTHNQLIDFYSDCNDHFGLLISLPCLDIQITHIESIIKLLRKVLSNFNLFQAQLDKKYNEWLKQEYKAKLELINNAKTQANELQQGYTIAKQKLDYKITELWNKYQHKYPDATIQQLVNYAKDQEPVTLFRIKDEQEKVDYLKMEHGYTIKTIERLGDELNSIKEKLTPATISEETIRQLWQSYEHSDGSEEFWQAYEQRLQTLDGWRQAVYLFKT